MFAKNLYIARTFDELALLLEIEGANPFKIKAYKDAARVIRSFETPISSIVQLENIRGIGQGIKAVVDSILKGEDIEELSRLKDKIPVGLLQIAKLPGLGPKSLKTLFENDITDLNTLERLAKERKVRELPGFGSKTEFRILSDIQLLKGEKDSYLGAEALLVARSLKERLLEYSKDDIKEVEITGDLRRFVPLVSKIELLVRKEANFDEKLLIDSLGIDLITEVDDYGNKKETMRLATGYEIKLHFANDKTHAPLLLKTTGPTDFVAQFNNLDEEFSSEKDIFTSVGYNYLPPEIRHRDEVKLILTEVVPELVELQSIKGDLHMHSRYSDGAVAIIDMAKKAESLGYEYIAITDHSQSLTVAKGLTVERLIEQGKEIDRLNADALFPKFWIFKGTEVDILKDGDLDFPNEVLKELDWVIASIHSNFRMSKQEMTKRLVRAIENPYVKAIGHISGRLLGRRPGYEFDWETILKALRDTGTAIELNATPDRLDVSEENLEAIVNNGIKIIINTDAHSPEGLNYMEWGVMTARRALVEKQNVLNTYSLEEFTKWLKN